MKHFSHHPGSNGFSFIEIVGSLLMMSVLLTALFSMEGSVLGRFATYLQRQEHMLAAKSYVLSLVSSGADTQKKSETKSDLRTLTVSTEPVKKDSVLARFEGLQQQKTTATWRDAKRERSVDLIKYVFVPPKKTDSLDQKRATSDPAFTKVSAGQA